MSGEAGTPGAAGPAGPAGTPGAAGAAGQSRSIIFISFQHLLTWDLFHN